MIIIWSVSTRVTCLKHHARFILRYGLSDIGRSVHGLWPERYFFDRLVLILNVLERGWGKRGYKYLKMKPHNEVGSLDCDNQKRTQPCLLG